MSNRPSAVALIARMFGVVFIIVFGISVVLNTLGGRNVFSIDVVFWVSVALTVTYLSVGWTVVTGGSKVLLKDDPEFQEWKKKGGRPYLDSLPWPIKPGSSDDRENG